MNNYVINLTKNIKFLKLKAEIRYLLITLIALSQQSNGKLETDSKHLKGMLFPYNGRVNVKNMLQSLHDSGFINYNEDTSAIDVNTANYTFNNSPKSREDAYNNPSILPIQQEINNQQKASSIILDMFEDPTAPIMYNNNDLTAPVDYEKTPLDGTRQLDLTAPVETHQIDPLTSKNANSENSMDSSFLNSLDSYSLNSKNLKNLNNITSTRNLSKIKASEFTDDKKHELESNKEAVDIVNCFIDYRKFVNDELNKPIDFGIENLINKKDEYYQYLKESALLISRPVGTGEYIYTSKDVIDVINYAKTKTFWWSVFNSIPRLRIKPEKGRNYKIHTLYDQMKENNYKGDEHESFKTSRYNEPIYTGEPVCGLIPE